MALTFADTQVADTQWQQPADYIVYGTATNWPSYVEHGRDYPGDASGADNWTKLNNNVNEAPNGAPFGDTFSRFEGDHTGKIAGLGDPSNFGRTRHSQARIVPLQEATYVWPYGVLYGLAVSQDFVPPPSQWPPHAISIEWEAGYGTPVGVSVTYERLKGVGTGSGGGEPGTWSAYLKCGADTFFSATGIGHSESTPLSGSVDVTPQMQPDGSVHFTAGAYVTLKVKPAEEISGGASVRAFLEGGSFQQWRTVAHPAELSSSGGVLISYTVRPPRFRYIYDYPEPGDAVPTQVPEEAGSAVVDIYGAIGGYGTGYPRLMHWTPAGGLVTVDPTAEWGRGTGPMVRLSDGRLFVYDADATSIGYTVDATLGDFQPLAISQPIGTGYDQLPPAYRAGLAFRPETDHLWLSGEVSHTTPLHTYVYSWHKLGLDGADLQHVANTKRLISAYSNVYDDATYVDGRLYRMSSSNFIERFSPRTGIYDFATIVSGDRPDKIVGGVDGLLYALKYSYDPVAGRGGYSLVSYNLDAITFIEAVYNYANQPAEQSLTPINQWPLQYDYSYESQDFQLVGSTFFYSTYRLPDQGSGDSDPSTYGVVALDLTTGASTALVTYPWLIDPAAGFWADSTSSLIVVTGAVGGIAGLPIGNRRMFK